MRIPDWTPERKPQPDDLVEAVMARRAGELLNLDRALLWSEPLARGWNGFFKNVRTGFSGSNRLRELGICTVALITGAQYEYLHHAPEYLAAGGTQQHLDSLARYLARQGAGEPEAHGLSGDELLVVRYAEQMTRSITVEDDLFHDLQQRFDTTSLVELTAAIAAYNMVARVLVALQVTPEQ